jgi:hypothetical protein
MQISGEPAHPGPGLYRMTVEHKRHVLGATVNLPIQCQRDLMLEEGYFCAATGENGNINDSVSTRRLTAQA